MEISVPAQWEDDAAILRGDAGSLHPNLTQERLATATDQLAGWPSQAILLEELGTECVEEGLVAAIRCQATVRQTHFATGARHTADADTVAVSAVSAVRTAL
jgi:hypothetical protein